MNEYTIGCTTPTFGFENEQGRTKHSFLFKCIAIKLKHYTLGVYPLKIRKPINIENMLLITYLLVPNSRSLFKSFLLQNNDIHQIGYQNII